MSRGKVFEARHCPAMPVDCVDYGVISHATGKEVCRVWKEDDARLIADLLNAALSPPAEGAWQDVVERVALAMCNVDNRRFDLPEMTSFADFRLEIDTQHYIDLARAAIAAMPEIESLHARLGEARRVIEFGYQHMVDGRPVNPLKNGEKCDHGRFGFEDCIGCYDEALMTALFPATGEEGAGGG